MEERGRLDDLLPPMHMFRAGITKAVMFAGAPPLSPCLPLSPLFRPQRWDPIPSHPSAARHTVTTRPLLCRPHAPARAPLLFQLPLLCIVLLLDDHAHALDTAVVQNRLQSKKTQADPCPPSLTPSPSPSLSLDHTLLLALLSTCLHAHACRDCTGPEPCAARRHTRDAYVCARLYRACRALPLPARARVRTDLRRFELWRPRLRASGPSFATQPLQISPRG